MEKRGNTALPSVLLSSCGNEAAEHSNGANEADVISAVLSLLQDYLQVSGLNAPMRPAKVPGAMVASIANRQRAGLLFCLKSYSKKDAQGVEICFHPASEKSRRAAQLLEQHLNVAVPTKQVRLAPAPQLPDFRMAKCPALQLRLGNRDHPDDAQWMLQCTGVIAHALAGAICEWFEIPCKSPFAAMQASVVAPSLALRRGPAAKSEQLRVLARGAKLTLLHREGDWQYVEIDGKCGYVPRRHLKFAKAKAEKK